MRRLVALVVLAACEQTPRGRPGIIDAAGPDAMTEVHCDTPTALPLELSPAFAGGGAVDLYGLGPGAWLAAAEVSSPPGELVYFEAYQTLLASPTVDVTGFESWQACAACLFVGQECPRYQIRVEHDQPLAPVECEHLYLLHRGHLEVTALVPDPANGSVALVASPLAGDSQLLFAEVSRDGDPSLPGGFGQLGGDGGCIAVPGVMALSARWGGPNDAGPIDAATPDAGVDASPVDSAI